MTDHRGLYDMLIKEGQLMGTAEKRLVIDMVGILEMLGSQGEERDRRELLKWVRPWSCGQIT